MAPKDMPIKTVREAIFPLLVRRETLSELWGIG